MAKLFKYKLFCQTEGQVVYTPGYQEDTPTVCPNDNGHTIDSDSITAVGHKDDTGPTDLSGKARVHETARPLGMVTVWTGIGDDQSDPHAIGNGEPMRYDHEHDNPEMNESIYIDMNCVNNRTWIHEGYLMWSNAYHDTVCLRIVSRKTTVVPSTNTGYNLMNGYLIVPAAGDGTIDVPAIVNGEMNHDDGLVFMPVDDLGESPTAFWNATWDTTKKKFIDISPAPNGDGNYNMFAIEAPMSHFVNKLPLLGEGSIRLQSADTDELGHGMRLKLDFHTYESTHRVDNHWEISVFMTMYRAKTI